MSSIGVTEVFEKVDSLLKQVEENWPKTFESILKKTNKDKFYIFTVMKKDWTKYPPEFTLFHQIRETKPEPLAGTSLRWVDRKRGTCEVIWALPHQEGMKLFDKGKIFANEKVAEDVKKFKKV